MILTCPECATRYSVPDGSIGAEGRKVRCQSCGHSWRAAANDEPLELTQSADPAPITHDFGRRDDLSDAPAPELPRAFRARAEQQRRLRRAATAGAVWAGLASVFVGILTAGWLFRVDVVELYPRAAAAYAAAGVPVNPTGLEFEAVSARPALDAPGMVLVSGAVRNVREREAVTPTIRIALLDAEGAEIGHTLVAVPGEPVAPGAVRGFAALAPDPGARAADIGVTFVKGEAAVVRAPTLAEAPPGHGLRPVLATPHPEIEAEPVIDAQPIETGAAPVPMDMRPIEAVSAPHHG